MAVRRWAQPGTLNFREAREKAQAFRDASSSLPPAAPGSPAAELLDAEDRGLHALIDAADAKQRAAAERARTNPLEKTVVKQIRSALEREGCTTHRMTTGLVTRGERKMAVGEQGMPDLLVEASKFRPGLCFWLEAKTQVGHLSPAQVAWHAKAIQRGQFVFVARSADEALAHLRHVLAATGAPR